MSRSGQANSLCGSAAAQMPPKSTRSHRHPDRQCPLVAIGQGNLRRRPGCDGEAGAWNASNSSAANCNVPFKIYRMDPATLKLTEMVKSGVYGVMGAGTGAIQVGNKIWVSTFRGDRIGVFPAK